MSMQEPAEALQPGVEAPWAIDTSPAIYRWESGRRLIVI